MDNNSVFATPVPIIGQPQIINVVAIGLMRCTCDAKALLMGPIGPQPFVCGACRKAWMVEAQIQITVRGVGNPVDSVDTMQMQ